MPLPSKALDEKMELWIGGGEHAEWSGYEIDSDMLTPADGWEVSLGLTAGQTPPAVVVGASVLVKVGGETVLTSYIDEIHDPVSKAACTFSITGRDYAADLVDCSAPIFSGQNVGLIQIVKTIVSQFNLPQPRIDADTTLTRKKISVEPGDSAWDALVRVAEANGLWPWFDPDGTLVVGGPDYNSPVVAKLICLYSGKGNNVISIDRTTSMHGRYSQVTVYGQVPGTTTDVGKNSLFATVLDNGVTRFRPKIIVDHECDSVAVCENRARKFLSDSRLNAVTLTAEVKGHRIVAPGQPSDGLLWTPGMRISVTSERHGIKDQVFFLMGRKFKRSRSTGTRTALMLKEDGIWALDAHPHNKNGARGPGQIINVSAGS